MNGKDAGRVQAEALEYLVPTRDWRVDVAVIEEFGPDFRKTIKTHTGEVDKYVLVHCWGSNNKRNPRDRVAEIVCAVLAAQYNEKS